MKLFCLMFFISLVSFQDELRTWVDASGKFKIEAELVSVNGENVKLRKADGQIIDVEIARLSPSSKEFLNSKKTVLKNINSIKGRYRRKERELIFAVEIERFYKEELKNQITDDERKFIVNRLIELKHHAENKATLVAGIFITPNELKERESDCRELTLRWLSLNSRTVGNEQNVVSKQSEEIFKAAQKIEPFYAPDFIRGLSKVLTERDFVAAEKHFKECLSRMYKYKPLLNRPMDKINFSNALGNLALLKIRNNKAADALSLLDSAISLTGGTPEVAHNINKLIKSASEGKVRLKSSMVNQLSNWSAKLGEKFPRTDPTNGWLYMPYQNRDISPELGLVFDESSEEPGMVEWSSGTGFLVAPGLLLTNRHVVAFEYDSGRLFDRYRLNFAPNTQQEHLYGKVLALSENHDLALIKCEELKSAGIPIDQGKLRAAQEIFILGYPRTDVLGDELKITRGLVSQAPTEINQEVVTDAIANPGNSGGPIVDANGNAIGVITWIRKSLDQNYSIGIPAEVVIKFIQRHVPEYVPAKAEGSLSSTEIFDKNNQKVFKIECFVDKDRAEYKEYERLITDNRNIFTKFSDRACLQCSGEGIVRCPIKLCRKGKVTKETLRKEPVPFSSGGKFYMRRVTYTEPCAVCRGKDKVTCPTCAGSGIE